MPVSFEATQKAVIPVQVTCERCGTQYTYKHPLSVSAKAGSRDKAAGYASDVLFDAIRVRRDAIASGDFEQRGWWLWRDGLGAVPCPKCGYTQSWQVKARQVKRVNTIATRLAIIAGIGIFFYSLATVNPYLDFIFRAVISFLITAILSVVIYAALHAVLLLPMLALYKPNRGFEPVATVNKPTIIGMN